MIARRVIVRGRVQGVWFRETTRRAAEHHGVAGWVRNLPDGRVEAHLEGDAPAVGAVVDAMRIGPPDARVDDLELVDVHVEGHDGFAIVG